MAFSSSMLMLHDHCFVQAFMFCLLKQDILLTIYKHPNTALLITQFKLNENHATIFLLSVELGTRQGGHTTVAYLSNLS